MTSIDKLIQAGIKALKNGERDKARKLLMRAVEQDDQNETAWLWLSGVVQKKQERRICLENVLSINPENALAQKGLTKLGFPPKKPTPTPKSKLKPEPEANVSAVLNEQVQDVWTSTAHLCAYCANPVQPSDERCGKCKRPLFGKELVNPNDSNYLKAWIFLRSIGHVFSLFILANIISRVFRFSTDFQIFSAALLFVIGFFVLLSVGLTVALYFRQIWAYWLSIVSLILSNGASFINLIRELVSPTPFQNEFFPSWFASICALPMLILLILYIYMIVMAYGDFKTKKVRLIASVNKHIQEPIELDKIGQKLAERSMWASAISNWQQAIEINPDNTAILRRLAKGYAQLGFYQHSLDTYQQAFTKTKQPKVREQVSKQIAILEKKIEDST